MVTYPSVTTSEVKSEGLIGRKAGNQVKRVRKNGNCEDQLESIKSNWNPYLLFNAFDLGYVFDLEKTSDLHQGVAQILVSRVKLTGDSMGIEVDVGLTGAPSLQGEPKDQLHHV